MSRIGNSAFTLVEVLFTVVVLAIGLVGILRAYGGLLGAAETSCKYIDAVCLAKEKMVDIELLKLQNNAMTKGAVVRGEAPGLYTDFDWEQTIQPSDDKRINIARVSVSPKNGVWARTFSLETYVENKE